MLITAFCHHFIAGAEETFFDKSYLQPLKAFKNVLAWNSSSFFPSLLNEYFHWKFGEIPVSIFRVTEAIKLDIFHLHVVSGTIWSILVVKVIGEKLCVSTVPKWNYFIWYFIYKISYIYLDFKVKKQQKIQTNDNFYLFLNGSIYIYQF